MIVLTQEEKRKIINYLYRTKEDEQFLIKVIYQDLKEIIPSNLCFCTENMRKKTRQRNYNKVYLMIRDYLFQHEKYVDYFDSIYTMDEHLYDDLIINFVFCLTQENDRLKDIHIFKDKRSICYSMFPITEFF